MTATTQPSTAGADATALLTALQPGQPIPFGGDRLTIVSNELAAAFVAGDRLVVVQDSGALLHVPAADRALVADAVDAAVAAFGALAAVGDDRITEFFDAFATRLADDATFEPIAMANRADVASAAARGRSTTRLVLSPKMREDMIAGLHIWRDTPAGRDGVVERADHDGWTVTARRAPLGVVGFVFEGRPNVFADATGVLRSGNTTVLRIGSDALGTAVAIMDHALRPALVAAGLPEGAVTLLASPSRATGWALFSDTRVSLAVARGSGEAVAQLGSVARQAGVPVSLHGTGGAWLVASSHADTTRFAESVRHSLDRKVCNTLNVCCVIRERAADLVPAFVDALRDAAAARSARAVLHTVADAASGVDLDGVTVSAIEIADLATEWEWDNTPEVSLMLVDSVTEAVALFNALSPRLAASLISDDAEEHAAFYATCDAPFVGNGFTRWVDGQFALDRPELGLSNWEHGRLFARSAVLSGDSVFTVRLVADVRDTAIHR